MKLNGRRVIALFVCLEFIGSALGLSSLQGLFVAQAAENSCVSVYPELAQRQLNLKHLQQLAWHWREQALPGVELWQRLTAYAVTQYPDVPMPWRSDLILQDLAVVILGPSALKYLDWFDAITPDFVQDAQVRCFQEAFQQLHLPAVARADALSWWSVGYAGKIDEVKDPGLDRQFGQDFHPEFNDGTDNQILHSFFYLYMSYVTQSPQTVRWASLYHEFVDPGGSVPDHRVALAAIEVGLLWRQWRDAQKTENLKLWPTSLALSFGKTMPLDPVLLALVDLQLKQEMLRHPQGDELHAQALEFWMIRAFNSGLKDKAEQNDIKGSHTASN